MTTPNYFAALGVHRQSSKAEIDVARRALAREAHPDKGGTQEGMAALNLAHRTLTDPAERRRYLALLDASGRTCPVCNGEGVTKKQKGFTKVELTTCRSCEGCGVILP